jgi:hypothetical protein
MSWLVTWEYLIVFSLHLFSNFVYRKSVDIFVIDFNEMYVLPRLQVCARLYTLVEFWKLCVCTPSKFETKGEQTWIRYTNLVYARDTKCNENVCGGFEE